MKRLNNFIERVGQDKVIHCAIAGWAVSAVSPFGLGAMMVVFGLLMFLSVLKEFILDEEGPDYNDITAALLGCMTAFLLYIPADAMGI